MTASTTYRIGRGIGLTLLAAACLVAVGASVAERWGGASFGSSIWTDRDLVRAAGFATHPEHTGAELSFGAGARVPGGLYYALLALPLALDDSPLSAFRFQTMLDAVALLVTAGLGRRLAGWPGALLAAALAATSPLTVGTVWELWNPGFLPLFAAVGLAAAARAADAREALGLVVATGVLALGAQVHLSALVPLLGLWAWALAARPAGLGRAAVASLLVVGATLAPYVVGEVARDFENTRALLAQAEEEARSAGQGSWSAVPYGLASLFAHADGDLRASLVAAPVLGVLGNLHLPALVVGIGVVLRGRAPAAAPLVAATVAVLAWFGVSGIDVLGSAAGKERYVVVLAPAVAALIALGADRTATALGPAGPLVWLLAAGTVTVQIGELRAKAHQVDAPRASAHQDAVLDAVRARTGWTLGQVAGRVVVVSWAGPPRAFGVGVALPIADRLRRAGEVEPGALPPPCGAILPSRVAGDDPVGVLREALGGPVVDAAVHALVDGDVLVVYRPGDDTLCPSNLSQRYLPTPEELAAASLAAPGPSTGPAPWSGPRGQAWQVARLAFPEPVAGFVALTTEVVGDGASRRLVLHSNQLRGEAWNRGLYAMASIEAPELVFVRRGDGATVTRPVGARRIGHEGALAPLTVPLPALGAGVWDVALRGVALGDTPTSIVPTVRAPFEGPVLAGLVVAEGP